MPQIIIHSSLLDHISRKNPYAVISDASETSKSIAKSILTELKSKSGQAAFAVIKHNEHIEEIIRF